MADFSGKKGKKAKQADKFLFTFDKSCSVPRILSVKWTTKCRFCLEKGDITDDPGIVLIKYGMSKSDEKGYKPFPIDVACCAKCFSDIGDSSIKTQEMSEYKKKL